MLEGTRPDHAIGSSVAITKLLLGCDILKKKKNMNKGKMRFFENIFSRNFLAKFSTHSITTWSGTQQVNFMKKFCVKAGIDVGLFYISLMGTGW